MNIEPRRLMWSIMMTFVLIAAIGVIVTLALLVGRGEDAIESEDDQANAADDASVDVSAAADGSACAFTGTTAQIVLYLAPVSAPSQQSTSVLGYEAYPIIEQSRGYYLLALPDGSTGWADSRLGEVTGECDSVPVNDTPLAQFPTVCTFTTPVEVTLFGEAELINAGGTAPAGDYVVEAIASNRYYVWVNETLFGWVDGTAGQLSGACDAQP